MVDDGKVEVRGVIAMNGRGALCFFAHSRADGLELSGVNLSSAPPHPSDDVSRRLARAMQEAPARRVTHGELQVLDPVELGGVGT